jgi:hypothetical protein
MCVPFQKRSRKARLGMVIGNFSLVAALLLWNFARHDSSPQQAWLHALCGLMFGLSIGANLSAIVLGKRCRTTQA